MTQDTSKACVVCELLMKSQGTLFVQETLGLKVSATAAQPLSLTFNNMT